MIFQKAKRSAKDAKTFTCRNSEVELFYMDAKVLASKVKRRAYGTTQYFFFPLHKSKPLILMISIYIE